MSKISFIIPVYNCEEYLEACVRSIEAIGLSGYEIILVDDGSTDGSGRVCDNLSADNIQIKCIHQKNSGVSAARNAGLKGSTGEYILFVDADDSIEPVPMKSLLDLVVQNRYDAAIFGLSFDYYYKGKKYRRDNISTPLQGTKYQAEWINDIERLHAANSLSPIWNKVLKRRILVENQLTLREDMFLYEDLEYSLRYLACCERVLFYPEILYHYRQTEDEGNAGRRLQRISCITDLIDQIENAFDGLATLGDRTTMSQINNILLSLYLVLAREKIAVSDRIEIKQICDEFCQWFHKRDLPINNEHQQMFAGLLLKQDVERILINRTYVFIRHWIAVRLKALLRKYNK